MFYEIRFYPSFIDKPYYLNVIQGDTKIAHEFGTHNCEGGGSLMTVASKIL